MREVLVFASHGIGFSLSLFCFLFLCHIFLLPFPYQHQDKKERKWMCLFHFIVQTKDSVWSDTPYYCYLHLSPMGECTNIRLPNFIWKHLYRKHPHSFYFSLVCSNQLQIYSFDVVFPNIHSYVVTSKPYA